MLPKRIVKDYLGFKTQPKMMALFGSTGTFLSHDFLETLIFSDKVKKINMFGWTQERIIAITTEYIYNVKKTKVKRKIAIDSLGGISKTLQGTRIEFTLHVPKEYDYRFLSEK